MDIPSLNTNPNSMGDEYAECQLDHLPKDKDLRDKFIRVQSSFMHHINNPLRHSDVGEFLDDEDLQDLSKIMGEIRKQDAALNRA